MSSLRLACVILGLYSAYMAGVICIRGRSVVGAAWRVARQRPAIRTAVTKSYKTAVTQSCKMAHLEPRAAMRVTGKEARAEGQSRVSTSDGLFVTRCTDYVVAVKYFPAFRVSIPRQAQNEQSDSNGYAPPYGGEGGAAPT
jgi:hypothetical protein